MLRRATISTPSVGVAAPQRHQPSLIAWLDRIAVLLLIALAGLSAVFGVLHAFAYFDHSRWYGLIQLGMLALALAQLWAFTAAPRLPVMAGAVVLLSGLVLTVMWSFLLPVAAIALAVGAYGVYRANRFRQEMRPSAAAQ